MTDTTTTPPPAPAAGETGGTPPPTPPAGSAGAQPPTPPAGETPPQTQNVPPTRQTPQDNKDAVIARLQAKIKKFDAQPPAAPPAGGETPPTGITEAQVAQIAQTAVQEAFGGKMQQIDSIASGQQDQDVDNFIQKNPMYAAQAETIKSYYKHPSRAQVPLESIANEVFGAAARDAMIAQQAGQEAANNMPAIGVMPQQTGVAPKKDWTGVSHQDLEAEKSRIERS